MKQLLTYVVSLMLLILIASVASAQSSKVTVKNFEGIWQVTKQRYTDRGSEFRPAYNGDFKIFDANGNFRHIFFRDGKYTELSHGSIKLTSDSTYTEIIQKHLAFPNIKEGKVIFKFTGNSMFLMKWFVGASSGEEVYEKVK